MGLITKHNKGILVALEGIHGCGKSTQAKLLQEKLIKEGFSVQITKEVSGTSLADEIYKLAFQENGEPFNNPLIMTLLVAASRASRVSNIIKPVLQAGGTVIADRYEGSMLVYQHYCDGVEEPLIRTINASVTQGVHADITFVIDVDPKEAQKRRIHRLGQEGKSTGWDAKSLAFHTRSREGYLKFAQTEVGWIVVDGMQTPEGIAHEIYKHTTQLINSK